MPFPIRSFEPWLGSPFSRERPGPVAVPDGWNNNRQVRRIPVTVTPTDGLGVREKFVPLEAPREPSASNTEVRRREGEPSSVELTEPAPAIPTPHQDRIQAEAPCTEEEPRQEVTTELEASRQRLEREASRARDAARSELIVKLFPVLDSLDRSMAFATEPSSVLEGVKLVRTQFLDVLEGLGVERIQSVGQQFDPRWHEAVGVVEVEEPSRHNQVMEEWGAGYRHRGRLLRPAKVQVGKLRASQS